MTHRSTVNVLSTKKWKRYSRLIECNHIPEETTWMSYPLGRRRTAITTSIIALPLLDEKELMGGADISKSLLSVAHLSERNEQILPKKRSTYLTPRLRIHLPHLRHFESLPYPAALIDSGDGSGEKGAARAKDGCAPPSPNHAPQAILIAAERLDS
jgi:hypothetical protein